MDVGEIAGAEFEEGGVVVEGEAVGANEHAGGFSLALEFLEGEDVEGDGVFAIAEFVEWD